MADDTTGNQDELIATHGSIHKSRTEGPTDRCKLQDMTPAPFENKVLSRHKVKNGTKTARIGGQPIYVQFAQLGPVTFHAHEGINKGVNYPAYCDRANPNGYSTDVKFEKKYPVRSGDASFQNDGNTTGTVDGPGLNVDPASVADTEGKLCFLEKIEAECAHGRSLGIPPGDRSKRGAEANYLEVLAGDNMTFTATRKNLIEPGSKAACSHATHTEWKVRRSAEGKTDKEEFTSQDTLELGEKWMGHALNMSGNAASGKKPEGTSGAAASSAEQDGNRAAGVAVRHGELVRAMAYWQAQKNPPIVTVEAGACAGRKQAKILVRPRNKITVSLFNETIENAVQKLRDIANIACEVLTFFKVTMTVKFLEQPKLEFVIEYKELTEDKPAKTIGGLVMSPLYAVQARPSWSLELSFTPLIGVSFKKEIPLGQALGPLGAFGVELLEHINVKLNAELEIFFDINPKASLSWDEYNEVPPPQGEFVLQIRFSIGIVLAVGIVEFTFKAFIENETKLSNFEPGEWALCMARLTGRIQLGASASAEIDLWCLDVAKEIEWKPESLGVDYGKGADGKGIVVPMVPWLWGIPL